MEAIGRTGYSDKIKIAIDVAATSFCIGTSISLCKNGSTLRILGSFLLVAVCSYLSFLEGKNTG